MTALILSNTRGFSKCKKKRIFKWTNKRLRTENRLLRQRIDYLEHESSALADRLVRGQVDLAQQADNCLSISHELHILRDINSDAHKKLEDAYEIIRELSNGKKGTKIETGTQVDDTSMIEHIHSLQQELIETHSSKADLENNVRELKLRVQRYQERSNSCLAVQSPTSPNSSDTPSNASIDPTNSSNPSSARTRLAKLTAGWMGASLNSNENGHQLTLKELEDQLMCLRIREADMNVELQEMRQKVMELETQNHVCSNQLKRQDDELKRVTEERDNLSKEEREITNILKEEQHKLMMVESEMKEKNVMQRLKYTEALQNISDLKQHIAQLESKNAEKFAHAQLRGFTDLDDDSITSNRSGGSLADANSINSEEMSAFLADVTLRHTNSAVHPDSVLDETDEEDSISGQDKSKESNEVLERKKSKSRVPLRDTEDTTDSGLDGVHN